VTDLKLPISHLTQTVSIRLLCGVTENHIEQYKSKTIIARLPLLFIYFENRNTFAKSALGINVFHLPLQLSFQVLFVPTYIHRVPVEMCADLCIWHYFTEWKCESFDTFLTKKNNCRISNFMKIHSATRACAHGKTNVREQCRCCCFVQTKEIAPPTIYRMRQILCYT
jgi:hypothetical protein